MLKLTRAARLILELLAQLVQQLRQTGVGSGHHPAMGVVHYDGSMTEIMPSHTVEGLLNGSQVPRGEDGDQRQLAMKDRSSARIGTQ